ncbi:MAG: GNAT family N-acetyltransferase [Candidatus Micrarchaeales archaeon]|nr:GNAT family N-acetyltransferase [Candidatus Micrarchaeales archaeon]
MRTKAVRISKIDVKANLEKLFALDVEIAKAAPTLLSLETKEKLFNFLMEEHDSETWVLKDQNGRFLGYLSIVDKPKEAALEILNIGIDPEFQGKGHGREMIEFAEKIAVESGRGKITTVTNKKNLKAIGFFKHLGYKIVKAIDNYYGDGETRYLFEKSLE